MKLSPLEKQLLSALRRVDPLVRELLKEHGRPYGVTDWGIVNEGLLEISRAIKAAQKGVSKAKPKPPEETL